MLLAAETEDDFFDSLAEVMAVVVELVVVVICCNRFLSSFISEICGCGGNGNACFEVEGVHFGGWTVLVVGCTVPTGVVLLVILVVHNGLIFRSGFGDMELCTDKLKIISNKKIIVNI